MNNVSVFCGSSLGNRAEFVQASRHFARLLAEKGLGIVYGGASVGLMGEVADAALAAGGLVKGIIPQKLLSKEISHRNLSELIVVHTMGQRKDAMYQISDAFVALPGGFGTLDEIFEMITLAQIGMHNKPCAFLNVLGYYDELLAFLKKSCDLGFIGRQHLECLIVKDNPEDLLNSLLTYQATSSEKNF